MSNGLTYVDGWYDGYYGDEPADESNKQYIDGYKAGKDNHQKKTIRRLLTDITTASTTSRRRNHE